MFELNARHILYSGKVIVTIARHWKNDLNYAGSVDDLISEGWVVLLKLLRSNRYDFQTPLDMYKALASSTRRRFIDISRRRRNEQRFIVPSMVDMSEVQSEFGQVTEAVAYDRVHMKDLMGGIAEYLNPLQRKVLNELVYPSVKTQEIAVTDGLQRDRLRQEGAVVKGYKSVIIRRRHVRESLGLTNRQMRKAVRIIRRVCLMTGTVLPRSSYLRERRYI